jgi:hypothetical protein
VIYLNLGFQAADNIGRLQSVEDYYLSETLGAFVDNAIERLTFTPKIILQATSSIQWLDLFLNGLISSLCEGFFVRRCWKVSTRLSRGSNNFTFSQLDDKQEPLGSLPFVRPLVNNNHLKFLPRKWKTSFSVLRLTTINCSMTGHIDGDRIPLPWCGSNT